MPVTITSDPAPQDTERLDSILGRCRSAPTPHEGVALAREAVELATQQGDAARQARACRFLSVHLQHLGSIEEAARADQLAVQLFEQIEDRAGHCNALGALG